MEQLHNKLTAAALVLLTAATAAAAQPQKTQALLMALGVNARQVAAYQWKQKTVIARKGNPAAQRLDEIRFDATGQMQRTALMRSEEKKMGPLMARKAAGVKHDVEAVMQLAGRYASPQQMAAAIQKGDLWEGPGGLRVQSRSALIPGDQVTLSFNAATFLIQRADIATQHEGEPVTITLDYQQLAGGPSMLVRMSVQLPADSITVNVESFDFVRLAGPGSL